MYIYMYVYRELSYNNLQTMEIASKIRQINRAKREREKNDKEKNIEN